MKLLTKATSIFDRTIDFLALLAIVLFAFVMLVINGEVVTRYLLGGSIVWVIEVTEYSIVYITFLGTAWLLKHEGHVKVDLVLNFLKPRTQTLVNVITSIVAAIACLVIAVYSGQCTWDNFQAGYWVTSILRPPKWIMLAIIPVGSFLLFIQFMRRSYGYLQRWRTSSDKEQRL